MNTGYSSPKSISWKKILKLTCSVTECGIFSKVDSAFGSFTNTKKAIDEIPPAIAAIRIK